ncbi:MAG: hypothetical protein M3Q98_16900 [Actinomycetota bacterium]|nr:hypothetical protein [Actinomycetota bacterium]
MPKGLHLWAILLVLVIITVAGGVYALTRGEGAVPANSIAIEVRTDKDAAPTIKNINCDDSGMADLCHALTPSLLAPVAKDQVCTMIYGGPETATIIGTMRGSAVKAEFSRTNGCEIDRWKRLAKALEPLAIDGLNV